MDFFPEAASTIASDVDQLFVTLHLIAAVAAGAAFLAIVVALTRGRKGREGSAESRIGPMRKRGVIVTLLISTVSYAAIGFYSEDLWEEITRPPDVVADTIRIAPRQFQWDVSYAGLDQVFGTDDDLTYINHLVLPQDRAVRIELDASDVIHSFFIPAFRIKRDAVPGTRSIIHLTPTRTGTYELVCTEYCGLGHYRMRGIVQVVTAEEYRRWSDSASRAVSDLVTPR